MVGINRETGTRWRYGRSVVSAVGEVLHYPSVTIKPAVIALITRSGRRGSARVGRVTLDGTTARLTTDRAQAVLSVLHP